MERCIWGLENAEVHHCVPGHLGLKRNIAREDNTSFISHFFSTLMYSLEYMIIKSAKHRSNTFAMENKIKSKVSCFSQLLCIKAQ